MQTTKDLINFIKAGYSYFYIQSSEINRASGDIETIIKEYKNGSTYNIKRWDIETDLDPDLIIEMLKLEPERTVVLAKNYNWFLKDELGNFNKQHIQHLQNSIDIYSSGEYRKILIIISDQDFGGAIPNQIQKDFVSLEYSLPTTTEIKEILDNLLEGLKGNEAFIWPTEEEKEKIIESAKGLTRREVLNALSYSIVKDKGKILSSTVSELQAKEVEKTAGLKIGKYNVPDLLGYANLKTFVLKTIKSPYSKGILLLGPAGTGKTHFCKWIAQEANMKIIEMEMAELFGSLVGESEKLMKRAIEIITANSPCILFIDEIEKGLAGVGSGQTGDGGTTKRSMAQFLKFLSDSRPAGIYVIATCNNISSLPPEWVRAERWDSAPFFVDLPNEQEAKTILEHYKKIYNVTGTPKSMKGWSGAEIKSVCRIAAMMQVNIENAEEFIIPVSKTMKEEIEGLRKWAEDKTIPSSIKDLKIGNRNIEI